MVKVKSGYVILIKSRILLSAFFGFVTFNDFPGIISQSVKDVLQSLVDDNLVDTDKIGTSVYFWSVSVEGLRKKFLTNRKIRL